MWSTRSLPTPHHSAPDSNVELQHYDTTLPHLDTLSTCDSSDSVKKGRISSPTSTSPSKKEGAKMKVVDHSNRRADGSLSEKQPTWSRIKAIEARRLRILKRVELPVWKLLFHTQGTCLMGLMLDPLIYITMGLYIGLRLYARFSGDDAPLSATALMNKSDITILGGFLSFFLVFFVNQTNSRFLEMYGFSRACMGRTQDVAALASTQFPQELAEQLIRHMNAAHIAGYVGLGGPYSKLFFFDHYNREHNLMTPEEMESISHLDMDSGSDVVKELVTWCNRDVGIAKRAGFIGAYEAKELHDRILQFRASMDGMYDYCAQPPHFFYIHFLCLLSAFYLPLFAIDNAYSAGWGNATEWSIEVLNGVIVLMQCVFVIGLRLLGQKMVDPYGDDNEDLSVTSYVEDCLHITKIMFTSKGTHLRPGTSALKAN